MAELDISRVIVFHKPETAPKAAAALAASFPESHDLFNDLKLARREGVAASYVKEADRTNAPLTFPNLGITLGYADPETVQKLKHHPAVSYAAKVPTLSKIQPVRIAQ